MSNRLYLVDANLAVQKLVEYSLSREGFEVTSFGDGLSAIDATDKIKPDIFIIEYNLAGIDISRFCEKIKKDKDLKDCPILLLVNQSDSYDEKRLLLAGITDFIKKPLESIDLITKAKRYLRPKKEEEVEIGEEEIVKIEELLGWSSPTGTTSLFSELKDEKSSGLLDLNEAVKEEKTVKEVEDLIFVEEKDGSELKEEQSSGLLDLDKTVEGKVEATKGIDDLAFMEKKKETEGRPIRESKPIIEESLPKAEDKSSYIGQIPNDLVEKMIKEAAREVVEKIAWEVIPTLAEAAIKKELERIKGEDN